MKSFTYLFGLLAIFGGVATALPTPLTDTTEIAARRTDIDELGETMFRQGGDYCDFFCESNAKNWRCMTRWPESCFHCTVVGMVHPCK
ncbi:hypothetical protein LTR36_010925 [Oleoguttula mirabilis]|uniref:Uncharacterized protein n=1 Tax=Oleoguttula mirabilis TaxID=1507867 RepID=A0AAV9J431_9PEZI|nr:hypothetical protein LTR36_010925 [Oleoguttula mirabilis]